MSFLDRVTPKMAIGGVLGVIAVALGIQVYRKHDDPSTPSDRPDVPDGRDVRVPVRVPARRDVRDGRDARVRDSRDERVWRNGSQNGRGEYGRKRRHDDDRRDDDDKKKRKHR